MHDFLQHFVSRVLYTVVCMQQEIDILISFAELLITLSKNSASVTLVVFIIQSILSLYNPAN